MPSHAIRAFAYDAARNELTVTFTTGRTYIYALVPPEVFTALELAASRGAYLNQHIRDRYPHRRARAEAVSSALSLREALRASR
jgi:hypothetical protein